MPTIFDRWTRSFTPARRTLLGGMLAIVASRRSASEVEAKKKRKPKNKNKNKKRKRKKQPTTQPIPQAMPQPNAFGCLNIGQPCN